MGNADGTVLPKPGIPKTLGILNVIFGVLLSLGGFCVLGLTVMAPALMNYAEKTVKENQSKLEDRQKARLKDLDDREKAATAEEEKKAIRQERADAIANAPKLPNMDMSASKEAMNDPVSMGFQYVTLGSGAILSLFLLVSGIGLIRLAPWGRSTALAWASLQVAQLVLLTAVQVFYVQPATAENQEKLLAKMEADAKAPNAAPGAAEGVRMARAMSSSGVKTISTIMWLVLGSVYPVLVLILLNNPGAKAALMGPKPDGADDF